GEWRVHAWVKQAILLYFRLCDAKLMGLGGAGPWFDKIPLKFADWDEGAFRSIGVRAVPGAIVRRGAFIGRDAVVMPSFVNVGAYVGEGTMVDTWATVGSCAQVGRSVHISGGAGIGGVLEPLQAAPTIIEDGCFIGARSEIAEGVIVGEGAVISMGVFITASTPIVDRQTGGARRGFVPPYSVVLPGTLPSPHGGAALACAVIIKTVDERTRSKTSINELLRD
ncbi:MAG: 2,3,4,5-tetrahydropyridine-2,6-dicarboxylate N-succinyltransferase, partial [Caulobacteraceae bacterium]